MFPELIKIGPFPIHTYGFMMMLAFAIGIFLTIHRGKKVGFESGTVWDLAVIILFSSLVGARALYVLTHIDEFRGNWLDVINPIQPDGRIGIAGMVLLGGVVTGTIAAIIYMRRRRLNVWLFGDLVAPALALGIGLGRIGCFATGCCYGGPTDSLLGVVFPHESPAGSHFPDTPLLPTQLISFAWGVIFFAGLLVAERWKTFDGFTFSLFLIFYAVFRILIDTVRVYVPEDILIQTETVRITVSQALSAGMIVFGVMLFLTLRKRAHAS